MRKALQDLKRVKSKDILEKLIGVIQSLEKVERLNEFEGDLRKLKSGRNFWRIKIGEYRVGLEIQFVRILHRKEIYKYFP